ncbi:ATP-binding cassette domain-containing protein [Aquabacterium sp.]|uniref:ATP-binding cassette domain-containing protein n=1 Tax=Aquabacterium sp. TaxID=1872578 RepID=UPI002D80E403|nr:ATP-binding cassette domain-containing protein [Aquabacterium sp.]
MLEERDLLNASSLAGCGLESLLRDVSLTARAGELLGMAGVEGNGQSDLAAMLRGQLRASAGRGTIGGIDTTTSSTVADAPFVAQVVHS